MQSDVLNGATCEPTDGCECPPECECPCPCCPGK